VVISVTRPDNFGFYGFKRQPAKATAIGAGSSVIAKYEELAVLHCLNPFYLFQTVVFKYHHITGL
jgi:hypothetical protein